MSSPQVFMKTDTLIEPLLKCFVGCVVSTNSDALTSVLQFLQSLIDAFQKADLPNKIQFQTILLQSSGNIKPNHYVHHYLYV